MTNVAQSHCARRARRLLHLPDLSVYAIVMPQNRGRNVMSVRLTPAEGRTVWYGPQVDYRADGMHVLSTDEVAEIDAALAHLHSLGTLDFPQITPETFPLPNLSQFFGNLGRELLHGRGFLLLRGLPRERYSLDDISLVYYGLGVHLGRPVAQSYQANCSATSST
jgi:hypothetical protein